MKFTADILKQILLIIENNLKFNVQEIDKPGSYDISCSVKAEDIINSIGTKSANDIRYCLAILYRIGYIGISNGVIDKITAEGYKFMCELLHGVNFKY